MTPVLRWIKSHLVVVICAVVIVVAPLAAWYVSTGMTAELKTELQQTASRVKELDRYKTTNVALEVPGGDPISVRGVVNPRLLEAYEEAVSKIGSQAEIVHAAGLARNQTLNGRVRGADDLLPGHFRRRRRSLNSRKCRSSSMKISSRPTDRFFRTSGRELRRRRRMSRASSRVAGTC